MKHPTQKTALVDGILRFKRNQLVRYLVDVLPGGMNALAVLPNIDKEDRDQLAQLIGYSVDGYGSLSYSSDHHYNAAKAEFAATRVVIGYCDDMTNPNGITKKVAYFVGLDHFGVQLNLLVDIDTITLPYTMLRHAADTCMSLEGVRDYFSSPHSSMFVVKEEIT
jgi:hypothetical protein